MKPKFRGRTKELERVQGSGFGVRVFGLCGLLGFRV